MFSEMLALARAEGWTPERLPENWPSTSSDTELILREIDRHSEGLVSKADARGLKDALRKALKRGAAVIGPEMCLAILDFNNVLEEGGFMVTEMDTGDTVFFER
jgi:hypothetical protein